MPEQTSFSLMDIVLIVIAFAIMLVFLRFRKGNSMTARKREEIERKKAAMIARRKAAAESQTQAQVQPTVKPQDPV